MTPPDLLKHLEAEGVGVSLNLKLEADEKPSDETVKLIRDLRDDLITLLALRHISSTDYYLKIATSSGKAYVMAKPHHIREAVELYPWGVVSDSDNRLITSWGDVPARELQGLHDLATGEPMTADEVAA
jgi:hypothetical protein